MIILTKTCGQEIACPGKGVYSMNMAVVSLIALAAAIAIGFVLKVNVGIVAIAFAYLIGLAYGIPAGQIIKGFSSSMAMTMIGVMYLFAIVNNNGSLEMMAKKITGLAGKRTFLLYAAVFFIGVLLSGMGPGAIPTLAIVPVLAIPVALKSGINPILLSLIGQMGEQCTRMSPITPEAIVVAGLMSEQGLNPSTIPAMVCLTVTELGMIAASFIYFKGWKTGEPMEDIEIDENSTFSGKQILSLVGLAVMIISVIVLKCNVGLASFVVGTILNLLKCGEDGKAIRSISWNTILLVLGMGVLMNIVSIAGGVDLLANAIAAFSSDRTASPFMTFAAGLMSFFASGLGVVFPTLIPTVGQVAAGLNNVLPSELMAAVVIGGTVTGFTPISTAGALILAGVSQFKGVEKRYPQGKMFMDLFVVAFLAMLISVLFAALGINHMICQMFA